MKEVAAATQCLTSRLVLLEREPLDLNEIRKLDRMSPREAPMDHMWQRARQLVKGEEQ